MKWIEIDVNNVEEIQIRKVCEIYSVVFLEVKLGKQQEILQLSGKNVNDITQQKIGEYFLEKIHPEWKNVNKNDLVVELAQTLRARKDEVAVFVSQLNSVNEHEGLNFDNFKRNERVRTRLLRGKRIIQKTLDQYNIKELALLSASVEKKISSPIKRDDWKKVTPAPKPTHLRSTNDLDSNERKIAYKIVMTNEEFAFLKSMRRKHSGTRRYLKKGEGTSIISLGQSRRKVYGKDKSFFMFSNDPYEPNPNSFKNYRNPLVDERNEEMEDAVNTRPPFFAVTKTLTNHSSEKQLTFGQKM